MCKSTRIKCKMIFLWVSVGKMLFRYGIKLRRQKNGNIKIQSSGQWYHHHGRMRCSLCPSSPIYNRQNVSNPTPWVKVPLPNTPGCWSIPSICTSKDGWTGTHKGGGSRKAAEVVPKVLAPPNHPAPLHRHCSSWAYSPESPVAFGGPWARAQPPHCSAIHGHS